MRKTLQKQSGGELHPRGVASDTVELRPPSAPGVPLVTESGSMAQVSVEGGVSAEQVLEGMPRHSASEPASGMVSGLPPPESDPARVTIFEMPSSWLAGLLRLGSSMPLDDGAEGALRATVQVLASILPECCVGARVAEDGGGRRFVYSEPPPSAAHPRAERLFPEASHERVVEIPRQGGWLHLAGEDLELGDPRSPASVLLEHAAMAAANGIDRVRESEQHGKVVAELRALKSYMVQAEKLASLGQMAAGMVHELNNPLTSIVAYSDYMLRHGERFEESDRERIRRIAESANRMLRFTRDLVSYARPSSELPVPVGVHDVINRALAFCEHEIDRAAVGVTRVFDDRVTAVRGKPEELVQIFVNLVTNACHAMAAPADGPSCPERATSKLTVTTTLVDGDTAVRVVVEDTGHGISAPHLPLVFAPFFTTKGAGQGTGLGLSIVKNIVESHHGEITAESDALGGARFIVLLPVETD